MNGEAAKLLDPEVLESLREAVGDSIKRIIQLFLNEIPKDLQQMRQALDGQDLETVGRLAHSLKSSSANLGAMQLSVLAAQIEAYIKSGATDTAHIANLILELNSSFDQVQPLYNKYLT